MFGLSNNVKGEDSFATGSNLETTNNYETAIGYYNKSYTNNSDNSKKTRFTIGIGSSSQKKNAMQVMVNGDIYIINVGGFNGYNYESAKTLQEVINEITQ